MEVLLKLGATRLKGQRIVQGLISGTKRKSDNLVRLVAIRGLSGLFAGTR